jgi:potassium inwardly-rectifying channel subfamily J
MYHAKSMPCVSNMDVGDFTSAILFSIETQQTIGYGNRYIDNRCKLAVVLVMVQSMVSVLLQSFMCGIVFAKLSRPKKRTETLIFSKKAVVAVRDGVHCLMLRVGDMRKSHIIQANVRMFLIRTRYTTEGEVIPWNAQELELGNRLKSSNNLLFMPIVVEHLITKDSPMWDLVEKSVTDDYQQVSPIGFKNDNFEIVVVLEGIVETTGATTQARTSYTPTEIEWNHIFEPLVDCRLNKATIDYSKFDRTIDLKVNSICPKRMDNKDAVGLVIENVINETTNDCSTRKKYPIRQSENINRAFDVYSSSNTNSTIRNSIEFV